MKMIGFFSRVMAVMEPLKVTITNFPGGNVLELTVPNFPADESRGSHTIKFGSIIYIEKSDFHEVNRKNKILSISSLSFIESTQRLQTIVTESTLWTTSCRLYHQCSGCYSSERLKMSRTDRDENDLPRIPMVNQWN